MSGVPLTQLQQDLRDAVIDLLKQAGITDVKAKSKVTPLEGESDESQPERSVILAFEIAGKDYEVWLYPDEAGVLEPGDLWHAFELDSFADQEELGEAVLQHLEGVIGEHSSR